MPSFTNRLIFIKMRRIFELLTLTFFVIIVFTISSKWSSISSSEMYKHVNIKINNNISVNPFLPRDQSSNLNNDNNEMIMKDKIINGRPDLAKYIHLDLKGAPPQANKFYETFFNFIENLQMGVKGIVIEYEDMLPLKGRLANVSLDK